MHFLRVCDAVIYYLLFSLLLLLLFVIVAPHCANIITLHYYNRGQQHVVAVPQYIVFIIRLYRHGTPLFQTRFAYIDTEYPK